MFHPYGHWFKSLCTHSAFHPPKVGKMSTIPPDNNKPHSATKTHGWMCTLQACMLWTWKKASLVIHMRDKPVSSLGLVWHCSCLKTYFYQLFKIFVDWACFCSEEYFSPTPCCWLSGDYSCSCEVLALQVYVFIILGSLRSLYKSVSLIPSLQATYDISSGL